MPWLLRTSLILGWNGFLSVYLLQGFPFLSLGLLKAISLATMDWGRMILYHLFYLFWLWKFSEIDEAVSRKKFYLIKLKGDCRISHVIFVDDLLIFGKTNKKTLSSLEFILSSLSRSTSLVMNKAKSKVFATLRWTSLSESLNGIMTLGSY